MTSTLILLAKFISFYKLVLLIRILLTWLPSIDWYRQPFRFLRDISDPVMVPFSRLIPPIGGIDFSPILLFFVLDLLEKALLSF